MNRRIIRLFLRHSMPMFLTLMVLGTGALSITGRFLRNEQQSAAIQRLSQIQAYFDVVLAEMDSLNIMFSTNSEVVNRLKAILGSDSWSLDEARDLRNIRSYISAPAYARKHIDSIYIFQENSQNRVLTSSGGVITLEKMPDKEWHSSYLAHRGGEEIWAESRQIMPACISSGEEGIISIYRGIYNGTGRRTGVMVLNLLKKTLISDNMGILSPENEIITILDEQGKELLKIGTTAPPENLKMAKFSLTSPRFNWQYRMSLPVRELNSLSRKLTTLTICITLGALLLGFIITYTYNLKERRFILRTLELLEDARGEKLETSAVGKQENLFDYMTENILQTFLDQDYLKIRKEAMEYRALQMQINPHFLFNTLETINWRAVKLLDGSNDISRMISLVSKILKYSMYMNVDKGVTLEEEIRHSRYYLDLQEIRFPGQFRVNWEISGDLMDYMLPRLIFQPLLENSFSHGFRSDSSLFEIHVCGERKEDRLFLSIRDNGTGMNEDHTGILKMNGDESLKSKHIGLHNVQKRLYLFFRKDIEIHLNTRKDWGTEVLFILPG